MDQHAPSDSTRSAAAELLARADALRDRREWAEAAQAYAGFLRLRPEEWPIWVQYGHCMKEAGDPRAALLLYREAERLQPEDSDLHLQIGHALKLLGRLEEAFEEYARALTLDPGSAAARQELMAAEPPGAAVPPAAAASAPAPATPAHAAPAPATASHAAPPPAPFSAAPPPPPSPASFAPSPPAPSPLAPAPFAPAVAPTPAPATAPLPQAAEAPPAAAEGAVVFDASDLLDYFQHNRAPTGIQRVQLNLIREALAGTVPATVTAFDPLRGFWVALPAALFLRLASLSRTGTDIAEPDWASAIAEVRLLLREGPPLAFPPGARLINLGTSWWIPDYLRRVREAKARYGLRYIPFIHDCIPLLVPEHCAAPLVEEFARWFAALALHADAVLTNSECTRRDVLAQLEQFLPGLSLPAQVLRLDAAEPAAAAAPPPAAGQPPFILCVGTIESRKNHLLLFNAWLTLVRKHGAEAVPELVCVGKKGWLAEAALALHANSPILRAKVRLLHHVPDTVLEGLYRDCLFTVYNSFYEGWGLPVTESLAHGKVALVPDHSSLREAGGEGALYFQPQSEPELVARLEQLIFEPGFRAAQEAAIRQKVRLRRWSELAEDLLRLAGAELPALPPPLARLGFRLGEIHELRLLPGSRPLPAMAVADAVREGPGWERLERWGCWATPSGPARLRLPLPEGLAGTRLRVMLELRAPPAASRAALRAHAADAEPGAFRTLELAAGGQVFVALPLVAGQAAELVVEIAPGEAVTVPADGNLPQRQVSLGVVSVMACREDDLAARLDYLERKALPLRALA
ncbi:glycosyltransferase family 4 protein [Siccirubricoccus phaeus]|uniref:glycosyltransferase family 4 protein n=1 Tax=Siccirubricoccus phaeus TaxID=2595053 RepID=UPI00165A866A|nr:glycosyltransferase [Siccirubricoccus phaeus]